METKSSLNSEIETSAGTPSPIARRHFLKNFILGTAVSGVLGREWVGTLVADCLPVQAGAGILSVHVSDFPALLDVNGSVRLALDPFNETAGSATPFYPILVNRGTNDQFFGLRARCTHQGCVAPTFGGSCPCHGSRYKIDGTVLQGPASLALTRYTTSFDGVNTVCIEIPTLGFNITASSVQSGTGPRVLLQFRTFNTVKYEIRRRDSLSDPGTVVPFSTTPDGPATTNVLTGKTGTASVYVDRTAAAGFYAVAIQVTEA
jgi:nitrite reductase/ring-hydroxylating ferredoxin subunit